MSDIHGMSLGLMSAVANIATGKGPTMEAKDSRIDTLLRTAVGETDCGEHTGKQLSIKMLD